MIEKAIRQRIERGETGERLGLLVELEEIKKTMRYPAYSRKVRVSNIQRLAKTIAFVQKNGIKSLEDSNRSCDFAQDIRDFAKEALAGIDAELNSVNRAIKTRGACFGNRRYESVSQLYRQARVLRDPSYVGATRLTKASVRLDTSCVSSYGTEEY